MFLLQEVKRISLQIAPLLGKKKNVPKMQAVCKVVISL